MTSITLTFARWREQHHGATIDRVKRYDGAYVYAVHDDAALTGGRADLFCLDDFRVESVRDGRLWLVPEGGAQ